VWRIVLLISNKSVTYSVVDIKRKCKHFCLISTILYVTLLFDINNSIRYTFVWYQQYYTLHFFLTSTILYVTLLFDINNTIRYTFVWYQQYYTLHFCLISTILYVTLLFDINNTIRHTFVSKSVTYSIVDIKQKCNVLYCWYQTKVWRIVLLISNKSVTYSIVDIKQKCDV
jgi:succinate dehydrogenase/fumarate reductase cytochrome b subunit